MNNLEFESPRYLEKNEYLEAKKREDELDTLIKPWFDTRYPGFLKPDAPDGYDKYLKELQEIGRNVYYTEFVNGVAY